MPNFRGTLFFTVFNWGWSENYNLLIDTVVDAEAQLASILTSRLSMMLPECTYIGGRVHNTDVKNDYNPLTGTLAPPKAGTYTGTGTPHTMEEWTFRLAFKAVAGSIRATRFLGGIPGDQVVNGVYTPTTAFATEVTAFSSLMDAGVACLATKNKTPPPNFTFTPIASFTLVGLRSRKAGRPFVPFRGRRAIA